MKEKNKNSLKSKKGITLIALVVTIVVLLILAGVSISMLGGDSGIITQAIEAKEETRGANLEEERDLWIQEREIAKQIGETPKSMEEILNELKEKGTLTEEEVETILNDSNNEIKIGNRIISFKVLDYDIVEPENVDDWIYRVEDDGTATLISYKGLDTEVIIPNYINGIRVKKIDAYTEKNDSQNRNSIWNDEIRNGAWHSGALGMYQTEQNTITKVIISEGIEEIGACTFSSSVALKSIIIPSTVKIIGNNAFDYNISLFSIELPEKLEKIGDMAFAKCESLTEITIPSSVLEVGNNVFTAIPSIVVNVPFKVNEKPSTWDDRWNGQVSTSTGNYDGEIIVNYKE